MMIHLYKDPASKQARGEDNRIYSTSFRTPSLDKRCSQIYGKNTNPERNHVNLSSFRYTRTIYKKNSFAEVTCFYLLASISLKHRLILYFKTVNRAAVSYPSGSHVSMIVLTNTPEKKRNKTKEMVSSKVSDFLSIGSVSSVEPQIVTFACKKFNLCKNVLILALSFRPGVY